MDIGTAIFLVAMWGLLITALLGGAFVTWLFLRAAWRFIRWCFTVTYHPRRR